MTNSKRRREAIAALKVKGAAGQPSALGRRRDRRHPQPVTTSK